jgi:hypothetical protein
MNPVPHLKNSKYINIRHSILRLFIPRFSVSIRTYALALSNGVMPADICYFISRFDAQLFVQLPTVRYKKHIPSITETVPSARAVTLHLTHNRQQRLSW